MCILKLLSGSFTFFSLVFMHILIHQPTGPEPRSFQISNNFMDFLFDEQRLKFVFSMLRNNCTDSPSRWIVHT